MTDQRSSGEGPLVGRVRELRELCDAFDDACRGRGGVHLVLGDPGVGKTRLAGALAEYAASNGARVIWTRGWGRAAPAYWPWVEVVRGLAQELDGETLRRELGAAADELLRLAPEIAERLPAARLPGPNHDDPDIARFALFDALVALLRARSASGPVVILIDDLQAVDEGSLVALDFVSRMLRDAAVLLVVTMHQRVPERTWEAQLALQNIVRAGRRLVLGGLAREDVGRLIEQTSGVAPARALVDAVHGVTEGNPFFAREVLALLLADGRLEDPPDRLPLPDGVRETIRRRLEPLVEAHLQTLELAAIVGRSFDLATLEHASPLARDGVLAALDAAAALGLVVAEPGTIGQYRFGHGLIGDTLVAGMTAAARMGTHRVVGEALEHVYRGAIDAHLPELAHQFLSASMRGDIGKAVDYAERAAQRALDTLAFEQAAELFSRALEAHERMDPDVQRRAGLLLGLGTAQSRAGRPAARATFELAVAAARAIAADEIFARAALGFAPFALTAGHVDDAHVALLVEALERIGDSDDLMRVRLLGSLAVALYWSDAAERRAKLAAEALRIARRSGDATTLAIALSSAQLATCGPDATERGREWLRELFELSDAAGETLMSLAARSRHIDVLLELDDIAGADMAIETLERLAREARDPRAAAFVPLHRARRAALQARFAEAQRLMDDVAPLAGELPDSTVPITVHSQGVVLTWLQHGPRDIGDIARVFAANAPAMPCWRAALAAGLADAGRHEEALLEFDRLAADDFAALPRDNLWLAAMALLTEAVAALDLRDRARELQAKLAPFAGRNVVLPTVAFLGPVEMWLGILARVAGSDAEALEQLAAARVRATRDGARASAMRIDVEEAAVLVRDGGAVAHARAEQLLEDVAGSCDELGLVWIGQRALALREELTAVAGPGLPSRTPAPAAPASPADEATLCRVGDVWTITCRGRTTHLKDGRGVRLLALLLERPGSEVYSLDLVAAVDGAAPVGPVVERSGGQETAGRFGVQGGAGPALDTKAKEEYRGRIAALERQLAKAESRRDEERARRARAELEFVGRELSNAVGIGGRDRQTGSHAERARINVTRALRSTLKRIAGYDARLGAELDQGVRTGTFCVYEPDPLRPLRWTVTRP
ncbi:MAG: AAA family ATPase [Solirubrobacteraceae bacterium]|nr:AAA family ATPase [Solirubrobacteraceae bacterium]